MPNEFLTLDQNILEHNLQENDAEQFMCAGIIITDIHVFEAYYWYYVSNYISKISGTENFHWMRIIFSHSSNVGSWSVHHFVQTEISRRPLAGLPWKWVQISIVPRGCLLKNFGDICTFPLALAGFTFVVLSENYGLFIGWIIMKFGTGICHPKVVITLSNLLNNLTFSLAPWWR